jgi:hypothetical protein
MQTELRIGVLLVGVVAVAGAAGATPSTIVFIPSTDTVAKGTAHLDYDTYFTVGQGKNNATTMDFGVGYGITDRWEMGVDYFTGTPDPVCFHTKYRVYDRKGLKIALGAQLVGHRGTTGADQLYGLGSYDTRIGRFAAGYAFGDRKTLGPDHDQLWLSWDKALTDRWWAGVDYASGTSSLGALSLGVGYSFAKNAGLILGYDAYNSGALRDAVTLQLDVNLE